MLAPRELPERYVAWNRRWGAPFGSKARRYIPRPLMLAPGFASLIGPFGYQPNNDTRVFEYPWAYEALRCAEGVSVLEIGGGLSGFQWVLARSGCRVVNVDPGEAARGRGWPVDAATIRTLGRRFSAVVELKNSTIDRAELPDESFDRVVSISVIEHVPRDDLRLLLEHVRRILKPGGQFVLTVDLFLDLFPFTDRVENEFGYNVSVHELVEQSGLNLRVGNPEQLFGYPGFDARRVRDNRESFLVGTKHSTLVQALVMEKS